MLPLQGPRFDPWSGDKIPHATAEDPACRDYLVHPNKYKIKLTEKTVCGCLWKEVA